MLDLVIIQAMAALFAFFSGRHDVPAIDNFRRFGSTDRQQKMFHAANFWMKVIISAFAGMVAFQYGCSLVAAGCAGIACAFIMWPVFDITINLLREGSFKWDYLGGKNPIDIWLWKHGGKHAGKIKTFACMAAVIGVNVLIHQI